MFPWRLASMVAREGSSLYPIDNPNLEIEFFGVVFSNPGEEFVVGCMVVASDFFNDLFGGDHIISHIK